jgi:nucleotide-binding universal stress UspA family protein
MPRILVALDGSLDSEKALDAAVKVAQQDGGLVTAVAVLEQTGNPRLDHLPGDAKVQARSHLDELLQAAAHFAKSRGVRLTPILREGHPADTILTCVEEEKSNLLVLGAGGEPGGKKGLGDTADQVSNHCPCTVLIVR